MIFVEGVEAAGGAPHQDVVSARGRGMVDDLLVLAGAARRTRYLHVVGVVEIEVVVHAASDAPQQDGDGVEALYADAVIILVAAGGDVGLVGLP